MNLRDEDYLNHVLGAISSIESYTVDGEAAFVRDRRTQDAVIRNLEVIGEAVNKLSQVLPSFRTKIAALLGASS